MFYLKNTDIEWEWERKRKTWKSSLFSIVSRNFSAQLSFVDQRALKIPTRLRLRLPLLPSQTKHLFVYFTLYRSGAKHGRTTCNSLILVLLFHCYFYFSAIITIIIIIINITVIILNFSLNLHFNRCSTMKDACDSPVSHQRTLVVVATFLLWMLPQ